jgi:hypothetical protein
MRRALLVLAIIVVTGLGAYTAVAGSGVITSAKIKIGGAVCQGFAGRNGVVCHWPNKPWAVAISSSLVVVWRKDAKQFVRSNR